MPNIKQLCSRAKIDRATFNSLRTSGRTKSWGDVQSKGFAVRLGLFSAFKGTGFLTPAAVDYADTLADQEPLPKWYARRASDDAGHFLDDDSTLMKMLGDCLSNGERWFVVIPLRDVRDRMRGLFYGLTK